MKFLSLYRIFVWIGALFLSAEVIALEALDLSQQTAKSLGAGGAYVSVADDTSCFSLNPAGLTRLPERRRAGASVRFYDSPKKWGMNAGLVDALSEHPLDWGFQFDITRSESHSQEKYSLGTGIQFADMISLAILHRLLRDDSPDPELENSSEAHRSRLIYGFDGGALLFLGDHLAFGASAKNLLRSFKSNRLSPFTYSGGLSGNFQELRLSADVERNHSRRLIVVRGGLEYQVTPLLVIRGGYFQDRKRTESGYTLGLSVVPTNRFSFDLAFMDQLKSSFTAVSSGLEVRF